MWRRQIRLCVIVAVLIAPAGAAAAEEKTQYYAVFADGKKIGHGTRTRKVDAEKVITTETVQLTLGGGGETMTMRSVSSDMETPEGKPLGFRRVDDDMGIMSQTVEGTVDAAGKLSVTTLAGDMKQQQTMDWPKGALLSEGARLLAIKKGLKEGTTYTFKRFAASPVAWDFAVRVGPTKQVDLLGRVVTLTEITSTVQMPAGALTEITATMGGAVTEISYVDRDLERQKSILPIWGTVIETIACDQRFALSKDDVVDFFDNLMLSSPVSLAGAAAAESITYNLRPIGKATLTIPTTDSQTVLAGKDGIVILTVRPAAVDTQATFPYRGEDKAALDAMKPTRDLQRDNEEIISLAKKAVDGTNNAAQAVRRIERFVAGYIDKKDLSVGYATAVEVAASRQGDCTEHAVLAAAMCRAVGIPARVVCGLTYAEQVGDKKHVFVPHAWVEAFVGEKWVGLDAAVGPPDARRIALSRGDGDSGEFFGMATTLGCFKLQSVEVRRQAATQPAER